MENETYIGDRVYASFDGYQIWLRTERDGRPHTIALENQTLHGLMRYVEQKPWLRNMEQKDGEA